MRKYLWRSAIVLSLIVLPGCSSARNTPLSVQSPQPNKANAYYVAIDGADSNQGTIDSPWKTLQHAADLAVPGSYVGIDLIGFEGTAGDERVDQAVWVWKKKEYPGFALYQRGTGNDSSSQFADPQFKDAAHEDFRLKPGSPSDKRLSVILPGSPLPVLTRR
ncbi:hypothetical protein MKX42_17290 [Paenibacillus sp. FSL R7-0204]|uniref:hypothetical protein n=1 Tax=Paenibacillus sp. FSL R7-0204 TaxID=2921675 RepID=UPI0030FC386D